jgi:predicted DNA repair protein MutK
MSTGLVALLDDVVGLAKVAAASIDDVAAQAAKAGAKAAGVVIDDAAVTPRYVVGFSAARELPIILRIAVGSLKNKLLYLLPAALALSFFAPWAITPLLMLGGAFLCYEGAEKVFEALLPHAAHHHEVKVGIVVEDPQVMEDTKVRAAIATDFILSAEIMAIALATIPEAGFWSQAVTLAGVGIGITVLVYGAVALIVKADDAGVALAAQPHPVAGIAGGAPSNLDRALAPLTQGLGRGLVLGMPPFLKLLGIVGTAAMVWVGGGIIVHGLETYGLGGLAHSIHGVALAAGALLPPVAAAVVWIVEAAAAGVVGLALGAVLIPVTEHMLVPLYRRIRPASTAPRKPVPANPSS